MPPNHQEHEMRSIEDFQGYVETELAKGLSRDEATNVAIDELRSTLQQLMDMMAANTAATNEVQANTAEMLSVYTSWKGAMRVLEWLGTVAKPVSYIAAVASTCFALYTAWRTGRHS